MSVTSAHPMVKDATTTSSGSEDKVSASSNPQGPGHASSDSEDEVSTSSDPKAWAPPRPVPQGGLRLVRPPRAGFRLRSPKRKYFHSTIINACEEKQIHNSTPTHFNSPFCSNCCHCSNFISPPLTTLASILGHWILFLFLCMMVYKAYLAKDLRAGSKLNSRETLSNNFSSRDDFVC